MMRKYSKLYHFNQAYTVKDSMCNLISKNLINFEMEVCMLS